MNLIEKNFADLDKIEQIQKLIGPHWKGIAIPENLDIHIQLDCSFRQQGKLIVGEMNVNDEGEVLRIDLEGGIVRLPFIILDYFSTNPAIVNYGRIMYRINENWDKLEGRVVGYSGERDFFVNARHELEKQN